MKKNNFLKLALIAIVVSGIIFGVVALTQNWGKSRDTVSIEASMKRLDSLYARLNVSKSTPK